MHSKICHLSSAHPFDDIRIFHKECLSLASAGYETHLVSPSAPDEVRNKVHLHSVPHSDGGRLSRMTRTALAVYQKARSINADLYHFHDPELIPFALWLRFKGKKVIYDVHEDVPRQTLTKEYIPKYLRLFIAWIIERIENMSVRHFDAIAAATPFIEKRFKMLGCRTVNLNNYPILDELYLPDINWSMKEKAVCYVGVISQLRGAFEMVQATGDSNAKLILAGKFSPASQRDQAVRLSGWRCVEELGQITRSEVAQVLSRSMAGLVLYHPVPNHTDAQPNKLFEYMSAGIPVISSNFPLWKEIVEGHQCGICVDPLKPDEIAKAIQWILDNPEKAKKMGENGRRAVEEKYNHTVEEKKLLTLYKLLLS